MTPGELARLILWRGLMVIGAGVILVGIAAAVMPRPDGWTAGDEVAILANVYAASIAVAVNARSALRGWEERRLARVLTMILATVYLAGYALLLAGAATFGPWSSFFRAISPIAWLIPWTLPAYLDDVLLDRFLADNRRRLDDHAHADNVAHASRPGPRRHARR